MLRRGIILQGFIVLLACSFVDLGAGSFLGEMVDKITVALPGMIIMIPPLLDLRGNINGALASRLGTGLNVGLIPPKLGFTHEVKINLASSLTLSAIASVTIGLITFVVASIAGAPTLGILQLVALALIAGFTSGLILAFLTVSVAIISYLRGIDPDNITAPLMATVGDFVTVVAIALAILVVG